MKKIENMDLIEKNLAGKDFKIAGIANDNGYHLTKIYLKDSNNIKDTWVLRLFPGAQIVQDISEFTKDNSIELIIIPAAKSNDPSVLANILHAGKHLRVV